MTYVGSINTVCPNKNAVNTFEKTSYSDEIRTLDKLLNPLWFIGYITGILPTNFRHSTKRSRLKMLISYTGVAFTFVVLNSAAAFTVFQLFVALRADKTDIHAIISLLTWFLPGFLAIFSQLYFVIRQRKISNFLREWRTLERVLRVKTCVTGSVHIRLYLLYSFLTLASTAFIGYQAYKNPDNAFFISSCKEVVRAVTLAPTVVYHVYVTLLVWISVSLSECSPGFVFCSVALGVKSLTREVNNLSSFKDQERNPEYSVTLAPETNKNLSLLLRSKMFKSATELRCTSKRIEEMWLKFKCISAVTHKSNYLFGAPLLVNHGVCVFLICSLVYSILYHLPSAFTQDESSTLVTSYSANVIVVAVRFVAVSWMASKLSTSVSELRASLSFFIGENWSSLDQEERAYLTSFLDAVTHSNLAASPCNLYSITPSYFLTVLGIVLSYVIVLLQSK